MKQRIKSILSNLKLVNILLFLIFIVILQILFSSLVFKMFLPYYFYLDFLIIFLISCVSLFFKSKKFDLIYFSIIGLIYTLMYACNYAFYKVTNNIFALSNLVNIASLFQRTADHSKQFPILIFLCFIGAYAIYEMIFIVINCKYKSKLKWFGSDKKNRVKKGLFFLVSSLVLYSSCFAITSYADKKNGNPTINHVYYAANLNAKKFGLPTYYCLEVINRLFKRPLSLEELKNYFNDSSYVKDDFTGQLKGYNVITIMFESGQSYLLNKYTMPNTCSLLEEGVNLGSCYSANNTILSEMLGIVGNNPNYILNTTKKYNLPYSIPNLLKNTYTSTYYCNFTEGDGYNQKPLMNKFGFSDLKYEDHLMKKKTEPCDTDLRAFKQITEDISALKQPFYIHFTSYFTHCPYTKEAHNKLYYYLDSLYGKELDELEKQKKWINLLDYDSQVTDEFRNYTLASIDFDKGLGFLLDFLNLPENKELKDKTLIVLYGDHQSNGQTSNGSTMMQCVNKTKDDFYSIKNFKTIGLFWNTKLNALFFKKYNSHIFDNFASSMCIYPTILDLLGVPFNPKLCQGKSIFDKNYKIEVFYSVPFQLYLNANYSSINGISINRVYDDNNTRSSFEESTKKMMIQLDYMNDIYENDVFIKYDYNDFMPKND